MTILELALCALLISCSAFFSSSEIALFSLSRFQLRSLKENFRSLHKKIKRLLSDPSGILITILVFNEAINISLSAIVAKNIAENNVAQKFAHLSIPHWVIEIFLGIFITTPIVLFLCEITPKIIGAKINRIIAILSVNVLTFFYEISRPIRIPLQQIIRVFRLKSGPTGDQILKESEFLMLVEEGHKEGAIEQDELALIKNVFELDDTSIKELYKPLAEVFTLTEKTTIKDAVNVMRSQRYSRIPVTASDRKADVIGILYTKDLLHTKLEPEILAEPIITLTRKPLFVLSSTRVNSLFRKFKDQRIHMAIVKNENGQTLGIVTMSDVLNELFEDLFPEANEMDDLEWRT